VEQLGSPQDVACLALYGDEGTAGKTKRERKQPRQCAGMDCVEPGKYRCASCLVIYYCSAACQKRCYPKHKMLCKILRDR